MDSDFTSGLKQLAENLVFFSEARHAVDVIYLPINNENEIRPFIAEYTQCAVEDIKSINPETFFTTFHRHIGSSDEAAEENAYRFLRLQNSLQEQAMQTYIYRVEKPGSPLIPVFIVCRNNDDNFAALETLAEEKAKY